MINVMILEDDPMVREINSRFLKRLDDFHLSQAVSCIADAKKFVIDNKVDLILLDIYLPKENGIDFLKWLRKEEIQADVILITADKTSAMIQEAFRYGAVDYLIKPFTFERFKESLMKYKGRLENLNNLDIFEQDAIDRYISINASNDEFEDASNDLIKGINKYTYKLIWNEVVKLSDNFTTTDDISGKSGVATVTVRRYLDFMESEGKVKKIMEYGKIGRPQYKYKMINKS